MNSPFHSRPKLDLFVRRSALLNFRFYGSMTFKTDQFLHFGISSLLYFMYRWFQDIITESVYQGHHTRRVVQGLKYGMLLFIVSEVMFFFSFFWAFFHYSLSPSIWTGGVWPPKGVVAVNPCILPTINTFILLTSGVTLTWAHAELIVGKRAHVLHAMVWTLCLSTLFTGFQALEYKYSAIHMNDSAYGSIFYMVTGFHGFHVFVGSIFILTCFCRVFNAESVTTRQQNFGYCSRN